jgi:SAM-dependent MidA family methyltransferase
LAYFCSLLKRPENKLTTTIKMILKDLIIQKIKDCGPISFHDYMEMALYYPGLGYYTSPVEKFGREGDYYTSPVISSLYGSMLGRQLEEMWSILKQGPFTIVEYGAGTGALAKDILSYLENNKELYENLQYFIIEKSQSLRNVQQHLPADKVTWINEIKEISGFSGCVLSNEVLDNFSVHSVVMKDELMEVYVDYQDGFKEILKPATDDLKKYLSHQNITLPPDYRTEINLEVIDWIQDIAENLQKGFVITVDYGYPAREFYAEKRKLGTLACYYKHTVTEDYYKNIGRQDITAHVNFTALALYGKKAGLQFSGFCNQNYFLRSLGLINHLRTLEMNSENKESFLEINKLIIDMGNKFKVLIQQKNVDSKYLTGMQFSGSELMI